MGVVGNKSRTGMTNSLEMRAKISASLQGKRCGLGNKSRTGQKRSPEEIKKGIETRKTKYPNGFHHTEATKCKIALGHIGHRKSPEEIQRRLDTIRQKYPDGFQYSKETRAHWSEVRRGRAVLPETRAKISIGNTGKVRSDEVKDRIRRSLLVDKDKLSAQGKKAWENPIKVEAMMANMLKARHRKPNRLEEYIQELLDTHFPREWKFVGDGALVLGGKCPDFVNVNGRKQIIEIFGDYWHRGEDEQDRKDIFAEFGYTTLVIWESEIKLISEDRLAERIMEFQGR